MFFSLIMWEKNTKVFLLKILRNYCFFFLIRPKHLIGTWFTTQTLLKQDESVQLWKKGNITLSEWLKILSGNLWKLLCMALPELFRRQGGGGRSLPPVARIFAVGFFAVEFYAVWNFRRTEFSPYGVFTVMNFQKRGVMVSISSAELNFSSVKSIIDWIIWKWAKFRRSL